jgi:RecA/RadA recombinase
MSLIDRLKKNSTLTGTATLAESKVYGVKEFVHTPIPMINVALSGRIDGGLTPGTTVVAGPTKHFKSAFGLLLCGTWLNHYKDSVIMYYDSEGGIPESYVKSFGIDMERVVYNRLLDLEQLRHDLMVQVEKLEKGDKVLFFIDSIGNLASRKEAEDAKKSDDSKADMTRAKVVKSIFRLMTPRFMEKELPLICVNHTYQTLDVHSKQVMSGGTGPYYNANNIWIVGREQNEEDIKVEGGDDGKKKTKKVLEGYDFKIRIEKSRFVKEKSVFPITVSFDEGIKRWSGLFEDALEAGIIKQAKQGWYTIGENEKNLRKDDIIDSDEIWENILKNTNLANIIQLKYQLPELNMVKYD